LINTPDKTVFTSSFQCEIGCFLSTCVQHQQQVKQCLKFVCKRFSARR